MNSPSKLSVLAVITARGGSKGLPGKNVRMLHGKPLIAWTIEAASAAGGLDRVILSTDDSGIASVAREWGCEVPFMRPADISGDSARQSDVLAHAVRELARLGESYDAVMCLQPTTPFRTSAHIDEAVEVFANSGATSLISLKEQDYPPWWFFQVEGQRLEPAFSYREGINVFDLQRQDFPAVYRPNGAIYIVDAEHLLHTGKLINPGDSAYYLMPEELSISIDTSLHFAVAEAIAQTLFPPE